MAERSEVSARHVRAQLLHTSRKVLSLNEFELARQLRGDGLAVVATDVRAMEAGWMPVSDRVLTEVLQLITVQLDTIGRHLDVLEPQVPRRLPPTPRRGLGRRPSLFVPSLVESGGQEELPTDEYIHTTTAG